MSSKFVQTLHSGPYLDYLNLILELKLVEMFNSFVMTHFENNEFVH